MKFLEMLDEDDLNKVLDRFADRVAKVTDASFLRHGFNVPHSATSVSHNIIANQTEKDKHNHRMLALGHLIATAKVASKGLFELGQPANNRDGDRTRLDFAIAAVEKDFKQ